MDKEYGNIVEVEKGSPKMVKNLLLHVSIVMKNFLPSSREALLLRYEDFIPYTIFKGE